jgi:uncharacterized protein (DUF1800 family)
MRVSPKSLLFLLCALLSPISIQTATALPIPFEPASPATGEAPKGETAKQIISPVSAYVYIGEEQRFTSAGATKWTSTAGGMSTTGVFHAPAKMPPDDIVKVTATGPGGSATATVKLVDGAHQVISPTSAKLELGAKKVFASTGGTLWSATYGKVTTTGVYTAPTTYPPGGKDTVTVMGSHGSVSAAIEIILPTPVITAVGTNGKLPLGMYTATITGTGFTTVSEVKLNAALLNSTYSEGKITISGFFDKPGAANITVTNETIKSKPFPIYIGVANAKVTPAAARRFLQQAAFGPTPADAERVQTEGFGVWIQNQVTTPAISNYNAVNPAKGGMPQVFLTNAVTNEDQLRQRVAFALSQIFVTSLNTISTTNMKVFENTLIAHAFDNYREIMTDVTLSPAMGQYLDMANNAQANASIGSSANENYARELMQLFTIGTNMLNEDGTLQLDSSGNPIPTYTQPTIGEFARVYTGWTYSPPVGKSVQFWEPVSSGPLVPYEPQHDTGSKQLLNGYVAPAGVSATEDLKNALDNIFNHPNVGPFVSTQLIQHLVKSNPSPAYVKRVAAVFANNGSGTRGSMRDVITAILLDPEARANDQGTDDQPTDGHLQEPALFIAGMVRAFGGKMTVDNYYEWDLSTLGQNIYNPDTVFNYYQPGFAIPGTTLMGGEFQINSPNAAIMRANEVSNLFGSYSNPVQTYGPGTSVNLSGFLPLANNPTQLVNALDLTLTRGVMPAEMKEPIITVVTAETGGQLRRVQRAIYLILTSNYYNVWH